MGLLKNLGTQHLAQVCGCRQALKVRSDDANFTVRGAPAASRIFLFHTRSFQHTALMLFQRVALGWANDCLACLGLGINNLSVAAARLPT
jgi:hypothetical protein